MAFRFPLEALLRLRRSLEQQQKQRLAKAVFEVNRLSGDIAELDAEFCETQTRIRAELQNLNLGPALYLGAYSEMNYRNARKAWSVLLQRAEKKCAEEMRLYKELRQEREVLDSLRARRKWAYKRQLQRREQQESDDLFLLRATFFSNGSDLPID